MKTKFLQAWIFSMIFAAAFSQDKLNNLQERKQQYEQNVERFIEKLQTIENDSLRNEFQGIAFVLFNQEELEIRKQQVPGNPLYIPNPDFLEEAYNSYKDLTLNYMEGCFLSFTGYGSDTYNVRTSEPLRYPFLIETNWQETTFEDGSVCHIVQQDAGTPFDEKAILVTESASWTSPKSFEVRYPTEDKTPVPTGIKADIKAQFPSKRHQFHFNKGDVGTTQTQNKMGVTLLSMDKRYVEIEVVTPPNFNQNPDVWEGVQWLVVNAKDSTSRHISKRQATAYKCMQKEAMAELLKEMNNQEIYTVEFLSGFMQKAKKIFEEEKDVHQKNEKNQHYRFQSFYGKVDEITVNIYDFSSPGEMHKTMNFPILDVRDLINQNEFKEITTNATVYDAKVTDLVNQPYEVAELELREQMKLDQTPAMNSKCAVVKFIYPKRVSSNLVGEFGRYGQLKAISFLNKDQKTIEIASDSIGFSRNTEPGKLVDFTGNRIEYYPDRFTEKPCFVKGVLEVNLTEISKVTYPVNLLPEGITIKGNAVLQAQNPFKRNTYEMLVKDKTGRYLQQMQGFSATVRIEGEKSNQQIRYYYGTPHEVEVYTISGSKTVDYPFYVKLTRQESNAFASFWN